jgi:hypothetical protein
MTEVREMRYWLGTEMTEPGYYWWCPQCEVKNANKSESWTVVSWHPKNDQRQKYGLFYGPLSAPVCAGTPEAIQ